MRAKWRSRVVTAADLQNQSFPEIEYVVPGLIPEGLTLLAGRPKIGKSWFALEVAVAIAGGGQCLGIKEPLQGEVLYLALEDNRRRLKKRMSQLLGDAPWPAKLTLTTDWNPLNQGGVNDIEAWVDSVPDPRLVIVDTLAGVKPPTGNKRAYEEDYASLVPLHRLANDKAIGVLVLHHQRKLAADDPFDTISGTLGLTGRADTLMVLARSGGGTSLHVKGRDIDAAEHAMNFDGNTGRWSILGKAEEVQINPYRSMIIDLIRKAGGEMSIAALEEATGMARQNLDTTLSRMCAQGQLTRPRRGRYQLPSDPL
jgi:hypothetical protein